MLLEAPKYQTGLRPQCSRRKRIFDRSALSDEFGQATPAKKGGSSDRPEDIHDSYGEVGAQTHSLWKEGTGKCDRPRKELITKRATLVHLDR